MPSYGQHSFLRDNLVNVELCVNALVRATLISTDLTLPKQKKSLMCKCPRTGNTHFYEENTNEKE